MSKLVLICFLLLSAINAWAGDAPKAEPACRREGGRVSCSEEGFKVLTDALIEYRGAAEKCQLRTEACNAARDATEASLVAAEAARKVAEDKLAAIKPPSTLRPVLAVTAAVIGAVLLTTSVAVEAPPNVRLGLGAGGLAGITAGFVFVLPERVP